MNRDYININLVSDIVNVLRHYGDLALYFPQIDSNNEKIKELYEEPYWKSQLLMDWQNINIHITSQMWGSTACGWGGMGGAAMTTSSNYIIEQVYSGLVFVYWSGKLAYVAKKEDLPDFNRMPSMSNVKAIYKNIKRL